MVIRTSDHIRFSAHNLERSLFDLRTLGHSRFDGILASMPQSGTHWVMYMLGLTLAKLYKLPAPRHIVDVSHVGIIVNMQAEFDGEPAPPQIPRILHTHQSPHYLLRSRTFFRWLHFPKHLILVRDIRDVLVSVYEKRKRKGGSDMDFSTYLRGNPDAGKHRPRIWSRIRFLNGWGAVAERQPEQVAVVKYEDLLADTRGQLARVCNHFNIEGVTPDLLDEVIAAASKAEMVKLPNPKKTRWTVRMDPRPADEWYSDADRRFVAELCRRNLKYTFGYRYW